MNQSLKDAIRQVEALPDEAQEEIAQALLDMALRKRLDAKLAASELRGGRTPHNDFMAELRAKYGG